MSNPVVIVGAGPVGLAAAAQAESRGLSTVVLEAGESAGAAVLAWGHVRLFSPWSELVDPVAEKLLAASGWTRPEPGRTPPVGSGWSGTSRRCRGTGDQAGRRDPLRDTGSSASRAPAATGWWPWAGAEVPFSIHVEVAGAATC
jgi:2-polyprenyl-6-methoxyphenol hydroxylase-like FAD-dependent oxidoreductase